MRKSSPALTDVRVRLPLLLAALAALIVYGVTSGYGILGLGGGSAADGWAPHNDCPYSNAPSVATISRSELLRLREGLRRIVHGERRRMYEQGLIPSSYAWTDGEPGGPAPPPLGPQDPAGYEIRWWLASGDDVVADVLVFAGRRQAQDFFKRASSAQCRTTGAAFPATSPPGGRNLVWRNPDGFAQEDVYLLRGRRVYRVSVVLSVLGDVIAPAARRLGFSLVDGLACGIPGAGCCQRHGGRASTTPT